MSLLLLLLRKEYVTIILIFYFFMYLLHLYYYAFVICNLIFCFPSIFRSYSPRWLLEARRECNDGEESIKRCARCVQVNGNTHAGSMRYHADSVLQWRTCWPEDMETTGVPPHSAGCSARHMSGAVAAAAPLPRLTGYSGSAQDEHSTTLAHPLPHAVKEIKTMYKMINLKRIFAYIQVVWI